MMSVRSGVVLLVGVLLLLSACRQQSAEASSSEESTKAKQLLQGVWIDEDTEDVAFKMQGDTVFYADTTSLPAYFRVVGDTLMVGATPAKYLIMKQTANVLWFKNPNGDIVKLVKSSDAADAALFEHRKSAVPPIITEQVKRDTVVTVDGERYHCYVAINPTKYKVIKPSFNEDGMQIDNVYYDNLIHLSIFKGATRIYSSNFRKQMFAKYVPANFLSQAILSNMEFDGADSQGFHFNATLCIPDEASCFLVATIVSRSGQTAMELREY